MKSDKITVLHIMHEIYPSGAEMMLYNAYPFWKDTCKGTLMATGKEVGPFAGSMKERGFGIVHVPTGGAGSTSKSAKIAHLRGFYCYMKKHHYDVVHIHRESLAFEYALIAKLTGSKCVFRTIHSAFPHTGFQRRLKGVTRWIMRRILNVKFIAISDEVAENELKVFGNKCSETIYNWCDNSKFTYVSAEEKNSAKAKRGIADRMVIVTVGTCAPDKGHELLIRAIGQMQYKAKIHYLHVGFAEGETAREEGIARELGVYQYIDFIGRADPKPYLRAADVYAMPSEFEGLSIAALEAIFTGMPVLLADVPGMTEFRNKGLEDVDYFKRTAEALAAKLDEYVARYEKGGLKPSRAQSERAKELYDCGCQAVKYVNAYKRELK
jgi:glycosyltransferase involved in cell wall biosynthesis